MILGGIICDISNESKSKISGWVASFIWTTMPRSGSILKAETSQISSLAENLILSQLWQMSSYCHTRLNLGFSAKLKIWQVPTCKMEPQSGIILRIVTHPPVPSYKFDNHILAFNKNNWKHFHHPNMIIWAQFYDWWFVCAVSHPTMNIWSHFYVRCPHPIMIIWVHFCPALR